MAVKFTAADTDYFEANVVPPVTAPPLTMACFKRAVSATGQYNFINLVDASATNVWFGLAQSPTPTYGAVVAWDRQVGSEGIAKDTVNAVPGVWEHACGVFSTTALRTAYKNGVSVGSATDSLTDIKALDRISIGRWGDATPNWEMDGDIAEVAIWDVALLASEVASLALGFNPLLIRPSGLVFYAPLIGNSSTERDLIGDVALTAFGSPEHAEHPSIILPAAPFVVPTAAAVVAAGRTMGSLAGLGGLAGSGGIAGQGGGLAG